MTSTAERTDTGDGLEPPDAQEPAARLTRTQLVMRRVWRPLSAKLGAAGVLLILFLAIFGTRIARWEFDDVDTNAFLTSTIGAPVCSRSSLIMAIVGAAEKLR